MPLPIPSDHYLPSTSVYPSPAKAQGPSWGHTAVPLGQSKPTACPWPPRSGDEGPGGSVAIHGPKEGGSQLQASVLIAPSIPDSPTDQLMGPLAFQPTPNKVWGGQAAIGMANRRQNGKDP